MKLEASESTSYRQLFGVSGFGQLAAGTVLARTAGQLWQIALILFVLQRFHSPALAGLASFLSIAPGLVVSPIAGALLDRQGRMRMIFLDYVVAATALVVLGFLALSQHLGPAALLLVVAVSSLTGPLSASGMRTLFPLVVPRSLWDRANGVDSGSQALATVVGPALAGLLVAWIGGAGAFFATAGVFALAMLTLIGITDPQVKARGSHTDSLWRASWQALAYVLRNTSLRGIAMTLFSGNIGFGIITIALPVLVFGRLHGGAGEVGELWAIAGVATVVAGLVAGRIDTEGRERGIVALGMGVTALGCVVLAFAHSAAFVVAAMVLFGLSAGPIDVGLFALRQRRTDPRWFGRVFAVSMSLNFAGVPIGSALAGPLVERSVALALAVAVIGSLIAGVVPFFTIPREG